MTLNIQFKKGALELCVLALLKKKDCYGFELVSTLSERIGMSEGTVYPLLKRLREDGLLTTYLVESSGGPPRKYYSILEKGCGNYMELRAEWREFAAQVEAIIDGDRGAGTDSGDSGDGADSADSKDSEDDKGDGGGDLDTGRI